jgi:benzoylformate decarboxylase
MSTVSLPAAPLGATTRAMSVAGARVEKPAEVAPAIRQALDHRGPFLIDVVLESDTHPDRVGNTCGQ